MLLLLILSFVAFLVGRVTWNYASHLKQTKHYAGACFMLVLSWMASFTFVLFIIFIFVNILLSMLPSHGVSV